MKSKVPWNKGIKGIHLSPESEWKKGMKSWNKKPASFCLDCGKKTWRREATRCKACFAKWKFQIKENHPRWQGGITPENKRARGTVNWKNWRMEVFSRDRYTCQECGDSGVLLEPHHIIPIRSDRSKLYEVTNGITLCRPCHQKTIWRESNFAEKYSALVVAQRY